MATSREVIELLFNAEYKGTAEVRALKRDLNDLYGDFSSGVSTAAAFTAALSAMELAAIGVAVGLAKAGVESAGAFNTQFSEISTLIDDTDENLAAFKASIQDYASGSTASIENINGAIYNAISAGVDYKDSIEFLTVAEKLSVAGKTDLNSAVQVLTGTLNAYGLETDQAGKVSDTLFSTVKNGVTTIPELVASLGQVTGTAANLGVSFEEVGAATSTLTKNGIATSQSMTILKAIISGIINPTKEAQDVADELGISLGTQALESKGLSGVLAEMADKTGGSKEQMAALFTSTEALNGALVLTSDNGLKSFNADLLAATEAAGATETAFEKMADNVALIKQTLANSIELTLGAIGEPLLDEFTDIDKAIAGIFNTIRENLTAQDGALVPVINAVEGVAETVSGIIRNMANNMDEALDLANLSGFTNAFDAINDALRGLDLDSPEGLARAITLLGEAFEGLTEFTLSAGEVVKGLLEVFGDIASALNEMDGDFLATAGTIGGWAIVIGTATTALSPFVGLLLTIKKMGGIVGAIGTSTAITGATSAIGKLGVAGAAFATGFVVGDKLVEASDAAFGWSEAAAGGLEITPTLQKAMDDYAASIGKSSVTTAEYVAAMKEKHAAHEGDIDILEQDRQKADAWFATHKEGLVTISESQERIDRWKASQEAAGKATEDSTLSAAEQAQKLQELSQSAKPAIEGVDALGDSAESVKDKMDALNAIEPVFDFKTAQVESQAKEIEAIMTALGDSVTATGESLSSAFGVISSGEFGDLDVFQQNSIQDSIEQMAESQQILAEAEAAVAQAKAAYLAAQSNAVQNGDALISIDGTNLEPQLEAFMFEILKSIQMRVSAQYSDFLLGMPE